jgi:hypothetical protein
VGFRDESTWNDWFVAIFEVEARWSVFDIIWVGSCMVEKRLPREVKLP